MGDGPFAKKKGLSCPLVSVIVSAYNRPSMLRLAIESITRQTYTNLEILIQDDSTTDDCEAMLSQILDTRIRYTRNKPSLGTALNLRSGYEKSAGLYFCTLNDDDLFHPEYISSMVQAIQSNDCFAIAFCDHYLIDETGLIVEHETNENTRRFGRDRLREGIVLDPLYVGLIEKSVPAMFALFNRSLVDLVDFPPEVSSGYDYWLTYLAVRDGGQIHYTPRRLTYYRIHQGSQTASFSDPQERLRFLAYTRYIHSRMLADGRLAHIHPQLRVRLAGIECSSGFSLLRLGSSIEARRSFLRAFNVSLWPRALAGLVLCVLPRSIANFVIFNLTAKKE